MLMQRGWTAPWMPGVWNLPGGGVDPGETPYEAGVRELFEEAGVRALHLEHALTAEDPELGYIHIWICDQWRGMPHCADGENIDLAFVNENTLTEYPMVPYVEDAIRAAFRLRSSARMLP